MNLRRRQKRITGIQQILIKYNDTVVFKSDEILVRI